VNSLNQQVLFELLLAIFAAKAILTLALSF